MAKYILLQYSNNEKTLSVLVCFSASFDTTNHSIIYNLNIFHGIGCGCLDVAAAAAIRIILLYNLI